MYARYRCVDVMFCLELPAGTSAVDGASSFVNPMTALGMVETMRRENHVALVHTAAASNLGQMLNRLCLAEQIPLVDMVRRPEQADLLRSMGAAYVCNSTDPNFMASLTAALKETSATLAFDAVGGGRLASQILACMEAAAERRRLQPVWLSGAQASLHLRLAGPRADGAHEEFRHGLGNRRLAAYAVPASDWP